MSCRSQKRLFCIDRGRAIDRRSGDTRERTETVGKREKEGGRGRRKGKKERREKGTSRAIQRLFPLARAQSPGSNRSCNQNGRLLRTVRESSSEVLRRTPRPFHEVLRSAPFRWSRPREKPPGADQTSTKLLCEGGKAPSQQLPPQSRKIRRFRQISGPVATWRRYKLSRNIESLSLFLSLARLFLPPVIS